MFRSLFARRFPTYMGGVLLGVTSVILWVQLKRAFAPEFQELQEKLPLMHVAVGGSVRVRFQESPEKHLIFGYPSSLFVGRAEGEGRWVPWLRLSYGQLLEKENLIGPFREAGKHEIRMALFICPEPGAAKCWKRLLEIPVEVGGVGAERYEAVLELRLLQQ